MVQLCNHHQQFESSLEIFFVKFEGLKKRLKRALKDFMRYSAGFNVAYFLSMPANKCKSRMEQGPIF